jgi:hypothetical protein
MASSSVLITNRAVQHPALSILEISFGQSELAILDTNEILANQIVPFGHKLEATQDVGLLYCWG